MATHIVRRGETLSSIAKTYSVDVDAIIKANGIVDSDRIGVNTTLKIPPKRIRNAANAKFPKTKSEPELLESVESDIRESLEGAWLSGKRIAIQWMEELLQRLRTQEANESVQQQASIPLTKQVKPVPSSQDRAKKKGSRSKKTLNDVKEKLKEKLGKEPHVVTFNGVKLTENEKKQIVAAVAVCEMNTEGFGSINADQEFVGRKFGSRGSEQPYSRIVYIGLSYGVIQYTQDSGSLGNLLQKMYAKNPIKFDEILGDGDKAISSSLIILTTSGRLDLVNNSAIPLSGQSYWSQIAGTSEGRQIYALANSDKDKNKKSDLPLTEEIRGKRVQPIYPAKGVTPVDIWTGVWRERFLKAGMILDFQEVQLEVAIENYVNPILARAAKNRVRSALSLAFLVACSIRGGPNSKTARLFYNVAAELGVSLPFAVSEHEQKCFDAIAQARTDEKYGYVGKLRFDKLETHRANQLLKDELGFLAEDFYDISTYQ